jgi:hypothetical protein
LTFDPDAKPDEGEEGADESSGDAAAE